VQWVEKFSSSADTHQGRRVFWGRLASGQVQPGDTVRVFPGQQTAAVAQVLNAVRLPFKAQANQSAGVVLDREVDVSRGDWLITHEAELLTETRELHATVAWLDDEPLVVGRVYWLLHGHRWVKAKVKQVSYRLNIHNLAQEAATQLEPNAIGHVELALQEPLAILPFAQSRSLGSCILVDTASHKTSGAVLLTKTP
jgi:sulfate adenylyltransferase subunit 1